MNAVAGGKHARPSPATPGGWRHGFLGTLLGDSYRRRLIVAAAIAIALHEIVAGLFTVHHVEMKTEAPEEITIAKLVHIEHQPRPKVHVIAPSQVKPRIINPAPMSQNQHIRRVASARPLVRTRYHRAAITSVPVGGHGAGTSKAKANTGGIGTGGNGTGQGGTGNGTGGGPAGQEPCGYVEFLPADQPQTDSNGHVWQTITMSVHYPDHSIQSVDLDYQFYYPSLNQNPFLPANKNLPATFQFPPAGKRAGEPPLVQYVMSHTTADGYTTLRDCPS